MKLKSFHFSLSGYRRAALLLLAGVHILYFRTLGAGFVTDFTGLLERLEGAPFCDFLVCFGFPAMHQVTNFFLYFFVKIFGTSALPWYLIFTSLHVANSYLGYLLARQIFEKKGIKGAETAALMAALLFMTSPYQAEAVVWKVCFNFLFCTLLMLGSLLSLGRYYSEGRERWLYFSHLLFFFALFTFELALALLLLVPGWTAVLQFSGHSEVRGRYLDIVRRVMLPQVALVILYFLLNRLMLGAWVGHYGEAVHLRFSLAEISANLLKYFAKYLVFWREMPHGWREQLMAAIERPGLVPVFFIIVLFVAAAGVYRYGKIPPAGRAAGWSWLLFVMALAPAGNLYVVWILQGENDRYGYLASLFFFMGLLALFSFFHRRVRFALFAVWLGLSVYFQGSVARGWEDSSRIVAQLLREFRWVGAPEVYVLAFPENYRGLPMFRDYSGEDLSLKHALKYLAGKEAKGRFYQIAQYNMNSREDGVKVWEEGSLVFRTEFRQWGNWWWHHGLGISGYETEAYRFVAEGNGSRVAMQGKPASGAVFIVASGGGWTEVGPEGGALPE